MLIIAQHQDNILSNLRPLTSRQEVIDCVRYPLAQANMHSHGQLKAMYVCFRGWIGIARNISANGDLGFTALLDQCLLSVNEIHRIRYFPAHSPSLALCPDRIRVSSSYIRYGISPK